MASQAARTRLQAGLHVQLSSLDPPTGFNIDCVSRRLCDLMPIQGRWRSDQPQNDNSSFSTAMEVYMLCVWMSSSTGSASMGKHAVLGRRCDVQSITSARSPISSRLLASPASDSGSQAMLSSEPSSSDDCSSSSVSFCFPFTFVAFLAVLRFWGVLPASYPS